MVKTRCFSALSTVLLVGMILAPATQASAQDEYEPFFEPTDCPFEVSQNAAVECGYVIVPEDHNAPDGPTIRLAVGVFKDQSDEHQPDPAILLCGGPGEKCLAKGPVMAQVFAPIIANRDFIVFDQRGVGLSDPALACPEFSQVNIELLDEPDITVVAQARFDALMTCRDRLVGEGYNLAVYNNLQNAADVEAIRVALGYDQMNLFGGSYGTLLAQHVMRDYPDGVRSVVMASVLPLETSFFVDAPMVARSDIVRLIDACAADDACGAAYPDLKAKLNEVIDRLNAAPVPITVTSFADGQSYDMVLTGNAVASNLVAILYITETLPELPQAIYDMYGGNYALMAQLIGISMSLYDVSDQGMTFSVMCADDLIGRTPDDLVESWASVPEFLRRDFDPDVVAEYGIFSICANWPVETTAPWIKEPLLSDIPTLALGGEFDPVTPPEYAELVASYLENGYFYKFPGVAHGLNFAASDACARSVVTAFLDDPMTMPDGSCIDEMPGVVFNLPEGRADITLVPFTLEDKGFSAIYPEGWTEVAPGVYLRAETVIDPTALVYEIVPDSNNPNEIIANIARGFGIDVPEQAGSREANDLTWSLYEFSVQGISLAGAIAPVGARAYVISLQAWPNDFEALYETVYIPAIDAFTITE